MLIMTCLGGSQRRPHERLLTRLIHLVAVTSLIAASVSFSGCGKDSYIPETSGPIAQVEFGDGIEVVTAAGTLIRHFADYTPVRYNGRPAIPLQDLIGADSVEFPDLHGYRFVGTDGFYANMPGKGYGDNTWSQLAIGYLDLVDIHVFFETALDPMLRKGHNVKWLIRVEVLRAIDVSWSAGRKLAPLADMTSEVVPPGFPEAGSPGHRLADIVAHVIPGDVVPQTRLYRVIGRDGASLPRLLTWEEMQNAYYLPGSDRVVLQESLGPAYQVGLPRTIRLEGGGSQTMAPAGGGP